MSSYFNFESGFEKVKKRSRSSETGPIRSQTNS